MCFFEFFNLYFDIKTSPNVLCINSKGCFIYSDIFLSGLSFLFMFQKENVAARSNVTKVSVEKLLSNKFAQQVRLIYASLSCKDIHILFTSAKLIFFSN